MEYAIPLRHEPRDTRPREALLARTMDLLESDQRVLGAWLGGSFGQGAADEWSDLDIHCYVEDAAVADFDDDWRRFADAIAPSVLARKIGVGKNLAVGFLLITRDWDQVDVMFYGRSLVSLVGEWGIRPLFDRGGALPAAARPPKPPGDPRYPGELVENMLYALGNLPVVVARNELLLMVTSVATLRDQLLIPLMHAERGVNPQGGLKRMSQHLDEDQIAELYRMPPLVFDVDALVDAHVWLAEAFIPRARRLAARTNGSYPFQLEDATLDHLRRTIGCTINVS